jgi:hypothetical protein
MSSKPTTQHKHNVKMNKISLLIAAVVLTTGQIIAQDHRGDHHDSEFRDNLTFGFKAGTNFSNVYDSQGDAFKADGKFGFAGGIFIGIPIVKFIGIQPELLFSQRGFKATGNLLGGTYNITRTTNYLDIPLLFAIKPSGFLTILLGPQYSYLFKQKDVFTSGTTTIEQQQQFSNDNIRKNTLCITGGLDINIENVVIGLRGGWDFQNNNGNGSSSTPRYKNAWYQATLGYRF